MVIIILFTFVVGALGLLITCDTTAAQQRLAPYSNRGTEDRRVRAELVRVVPGNPGSADGTLSWRSFGDNCYDDSRAGKVDALGNRDPVVAYEAQFAISGTGDWVSLSNAIMGTREQLNYKRTDLHEKQRIFTRADAGQTIVDGFFKLTLSYAGFSALDVRQRTITPQIPFDASEQQMKVALESLDVISNVQVFRSVSPTSPGGYEWTILFDPPVTSRIDHGELPLLILYTETISAVWSGPGDQVAIQSLREAKLDQVVCSTECSYDAVNLPSGQALVFRIRARFAHLGWSEWSQTSAALQVPPTCKSQDYHEDFKAGLVASC